MTASEFSLQRVIDPVTPEEFFREYWEAKPLVVTRGQPDNFESLLSLNEIDRVITTLNLPFPDIDVVNAEEAVERDQYTVRGNVIDVAKLYQLFVDGSTIILQQLHKRVPSLTAFCRAMEQDFNVPFQTNIYLTPGNAQGFRTHYDTHDVFVLQITGSKHWKIYEMPVALPFRGQPFDSSLHEPGATTLEFDLHAGDTVYIPRGIMHDARSRDEVSLHITVGILAYTWTDLLLEALSAVSLRDPAFRKTLPVGFARAEFDRAQAQETFHELLQRFVADADLDVALDHFADELVSARPPLLRGQMAQITSLDKLTIDSVAGVRPGLVCRFQEDGESIRVGCYGKEISLPIHASEAVRFALRNLRFAVRDLPGGLDDAGKLVLLRRLLREGLVMVL